MNRGNTNQRPPHNKVDILVERLNRKIARLMGKKGKLPPQKKTSNTTFSILVVVFSILLWLSTGFYYLGENQFGLIMQNGSVSKVVKGIKVGFTAPYPFGNIEVVDANLSDLIDLNKLSLNSGDFSVMSEDLFPVLIATKFSYQILDPKLAFQSILQKQEDIDAYVAWQLEVAEHAYFMHKKNSEILKANLTISANEIRDQLNRQLTKSGVVLVKLNIYSIHSPNTSSASGDQSKIEQQAKSSPKDQVSSNIVGLSEQIISEANLYKQNLLLDTQVNINHFNQLLPQYRSNPNAIVEQMYYDTLSAIPQIEEKNYLLLNLPLSQFIMQNKVMLQKDNDAGIASAANSSTVMRERHFGRSVNRSRSFNNGSGGQ